LAVAVGLGLVFSIPLPAHGNPPCPWDCQTTPDGVVNVSDFLRLLAQWNQAGASCDVDGGGVGVTDFLAMLANWGTCPECKSNSECADGDPCTADECVAGECVSTPIQPCCGNGILEPGEECDPPNDQACPGQCQFDCTCDVGGCGDSGTGDCCVANGTPACDDFFCCDFVCSIDSFCCETEWDAQCAALAQQTCVICF
jgi:hypothetical protein